MKLEQLFELHADLAPPSSAGLGPYGRRVIYEVTGGSFSSTGPNVGTLDGEIIPPAGDWVLITGEVARLEIRLGLRTHDGWVIYMNANGILVVNDAVKARMSDPNAATNYHDTYFMTQVRFETGSQTAQGNNENPYCWMNDLLAVGEGRLGPAWPGHMAAQFIEARLFRLQN